MDMNSQQLIAVAAVCIFTAVLILIMLHNGKK